MYHVVYKDSRGWLYQVMPGLGEAWKARFKAPHHSGWHCVPQLPWRESEEAAEEDLRAYAAKKKMYPLPEIVEADAP